VRGPLAAAEARQRSLEGAGVADAAAWSSLHSYLATAFAARDPAGATPVDTPASASLADALDSFLRAAGGAGDAPIPAARGLPPSLDLALAHLIDAETVSMGTPGPRGAMATLDAAESVEPTLDAWRALLSPSAAAPHVDPSAVLSVLGPHPSVAALAAAAEGVRQPAVRAPPPLADLLAGDGMDAADAARAAATLPEPVAAALAAELAASQGVRQAWADLTASLPADEAQALAATPQVAALLQQASWTPQQAKLVQQWAEATAHVDPARLEDLRAADAAAAQWTQQAAALLQAAKPSALGAPAADGLVPSQQDGAPSASSAGGLLGLPDLSLDAVAQAAADAAAALARQAEGLLPGLPAPTAPGPAPGAPAPGAPDGDLPAVPTLPVDCVDSPYSDCANDILFRVEAGYGILVTGPGSSHLNATPVFGLPPAISIDLGGDDEFGFPVAAETGSFAVHLDLGGNDTYVSPDALAQGAALGPGAVAILWDLSGDDRYTITADVTPTVQGYAQGAGAFGGLGMLVDQQGSDAYTAPQRLAQGVGTEFGLPSLDSNGAIIDAGGAGILLDLGSGADRFVAAQGQGHSEGAGTLGILLDAYGATTYDVLHPSRASQGGRGNLDPEAAVQGRGSNPGLALLVDLGGAGDRYDSPAFASPGLDVPGQSLYRRAPVSEPVKQDDSLWLDWRDGLALGVDSTLDDADGDHVPSLVELLAGSDPARADDTPAQAAGGLPETVAEAMVGLQALVTDSDHDGFPDAVEQQAGTDPSDPQSTPATLPETGAGMLLDLAVLCPASNTTQCGGAPTCPADAGDSCVSLLSLGGPGETTFTHPAVLQVDLGGNDRYVGPAGASLTFWLPHTLTTVTTPGLTLDLQGDDVYGSPAAKQTEGWTDGMVGILLDLAGNDTYLAADQAQAMSNGNNGVAILADLAGNDTYASHGRAQAYANSPIATNDNTWAALVDIAGDDNYTFATQATVTGLPAEALATLIDGGGRDTYASVVLPADPAGPTPDFPATIFEAQGRIDVGPSTAVRPALAGIFADLGSEPDRYTTLDPTGATADVSAQKDGAGLVANPVHAPTGARTATTGPTFAAADFLDGGDPQRDSDGDGAPDLLEILAGTDPRDPQQAPVGGDQPVAQVTPDGGLAGTLGPFGTLRLPGLVVGSDGPDTYADYVPFLVDLGGNDAYVAPSAGGTMAPQHAVGATQGIQLGSVAVLLDLGAGDDTYHPADCVADAAPVDGNVATHADYAAGGDPQDAALTGTPSPLVATCPSLGGAALGVAVLADNGGRNDFLSRTWVNASAESIVDRHVQVQAWGTTQGSALFDGVGVLATWNATNRFRAEVHASARETDPVPAPSALATGLAQGAAWGPGVGVLASFGTAADSYDVEADAHAPRASGDAGVGEALSQGAARGGQGILLDQGGDNQFLAPAGLAQGFAAPVVAPGSAAGFAVPDEGTAGAPQGILWSGPGDDTYVGGDESQGSGGDELVGHAAHSLGLLVDGGGDDLYRLADAPAAQAPRYPCVAAPSRCAFSQGAGRSDGEGVLLDLAGDDRYEAAARSFVQGVTMGAGSVGAAIDLGGDDWRQAARQGQAYAGPGTTGLALLADVSGADAYVLREKGQGYSEGAIGGQALFFDTAGLDRYDYGGSKTSANANPAPADGNEWVWTAHAATADLGVDVDAPGHALDAYRQAAGVAGVTPADAGSVSMLAYEDGDAAHPLADGATARDALVLTATAKPSSGFQVERVTFLLDGAPLGVAQPSGPAAGDGSRSFTLRWDTRGHPQAPADVLVPDGAHTLAATAWFHAAHPDPHAGFVAAPDGVEARTKDLGVVVDNPPVAAGVLDSSGLSLLGRNAISPGLSLGDRAQTFTTAFTAPPAGDCVGRSATFTWTVGLGKTLGDVVHLKVDATANRTDPSLRLRLMSPDGTIGEARSIDAAGLFPVGDYRLDVDSCLNGNETVDLTAVASFTQVATLAVGVARDAAWPAGHDASEGQPGAAVTVVLRDATRAGGPSFTVAQAYVPNGTTTFRLDGHCPDASSPACPDGLYMVNTTVRDQAGHTTWLPELPLLIDGTAPRSTVTLPALPQWTGLGDKVGFTGLAVRWSSDDDPQGLGAANVAGISGDLGRVAVLRLDEAGNVVEGQQFGGTARSYPFQDPPVGTGDHVRLLTVATDALGNQESPCLPGEPAPCFRAKAGQDGAVRQVGVDFSPPVAQDLRISRTSVQPGVPVTVSINASDEAPGLVVQLRIAGAKVGGVQDPTLPMAQVTEGVYAATVTFDAPATPSEDHFSYTVSATDRAGNQNSQAGTGVLDSRQPDLDGLRISYTYNGTSAEQGRPGSLALLEVSASDQEIAKVTSWVGGLAPEAACAPDAGALWQCQVPIPANATDGSYAALVNATDSAGNLRTVAGTIVVAGLPPAIEDANATAVGPDAVQVTWNTTVPATGEVRFGPSTVRLDSTASEPCPEAAAPDGSCAHPALGLHHAVTVTGLRPGSTYLFRPVSASASGVANDTSAPLLAKTGTGYVLDLPGLDPLHAWSGRHDVTIGVTPLVGTGDVKVAVLLRDAANRTQDVGSFTGLGPHQLTVDTTAFADGAYVLVVDGDRQGDKLELVSPPLRLDNTPPVIVPVAPRPASVLRDAHPTVDVAVTDPFSTQLPPIETLQARIDGTLFTPVAPIYTFKGSVAHLTFGVPAAIPDGDHTFRVRLADAAGVVGEGAWAFTVDASAPVLHGEPVVTYQPGPVAAAPGSLVTVALNATDHSDVANVSLDLAPAGGKLVPMFGHAGHLWNVTFTVPEAAPSGNLTIPVLASDGLGNAGRIGGLTLAVDRQPPELRQPSVLHLGFTSADLAVDTDEPTVVVAGDHLPTVVHAADLSTGHRLVVTGLVPGKLNAVHLRAVDGAGNPALLVLPVTPPSDDVPPSAPLHVEATSPLEGVVDLSWAAATDNAGVDHYEIVRQQAGNSTVLQTNATTLSDGGAAPGEPAGYDIVAVDVAGLIGPSAHVDVQVLAFPRILTASVSPTSGPSDRPFHVEVLYSHPAGHAPDELDFVLGDSSYPLHPDGAGDCRTGCKYGGDIFLPARSTLQAKPAAAVVATVGGQSASIPMEPPLVTSGAGEGAIAGSHPAPLGVLPTVAALAVAVLLVRPRRRTP